MTELLVSRGDTFPRSLLDTYRQSRASESFYCDLKTSKSDELVLQQGAADDIHVPQDLHHGHSENLLDSHLIESSGVVGKCLSPTEPDFLDKPEVCTSLPPVAPSRDREQRHRRRKVTVYDRVDPEDSIRDIVTENDFYRFVLFKKHYDKYLHLSQKYEEARNIAYYLEEKYHEVKSERDGLLQQRDQLSRRLESNECLLREKEDEVFVQFERVVYLEEQCDKLRAEKEKCWEQKQRIEKERDEALRILKDQAKESESNRRKLERARQEVFRHMTKIKSEKESLERENGQLKEELEATTLRLHRQRRHRSKPPPSSTTTSTPSPYHNHTSSTQPSSHPCQSIIRDRVEAPMTVREAALCSQFQKAMHHLATCKRRKCSVCGYTRAAFGKMGGASNGKQPKDKRLFSCLQTPFLEVRNMLKPPPSPLRTHPTNSNDEAESLSEWFCPLNNSTDDDDDDDAGDERTSHSCSSSGGLSVPFAGMTISYMDDTSSEVSCRGGLGEEVDEEIVCGGVKVRQMDGTFGHSSTRGFGSDSGFSSDMCATPKDKFSPRGTLDEAECAKLTRTKWTASFRKLINRIKK